MTLAEQIAFDILKALGYREPKQFSRWSEMAELAQNRITSEMDTMTRLAKQDAQRTLNSPHPEQR